MRNELQAAVDYFKSLLQTIADDEWNREARNSATAALSALRDALQRQPDPITGLMPCGCGGKAKVWPSDLRRAMVTDYEVVCTECAMTTGWVRGKQENAMKFWNTAMGWKGGAE